MLISAIILAAGQSKRMGEPKMLLPWGSVTVIEHVIGVFASAGVDDVLVVTGGAREQVEDVVRHSAIRYPVRSVYNDQYENGEMLSSILCGLRGVVDKGVGAAMIGLGDQPQVHERSVRLVVDAYLQTGNPIVVPSYQMRRGHPWLVARPLWGEIVELDAGQSPRDFLNKHAGTIQYVDVDTPDVLADLDTPDDYRAAQQKYS
jgi:molybdenum cofactor cytidylyltransferase